MATIMAGSEMLLNGTSEVELVAAPATNYVRAVKTVSVYNQDSVEVFVQLAVKKTGTLYPVWSGTLVVNQPFVWTDVLILDATDESLVAQMDAAVTTTAPAVVCAWMEEGD